MIVVQVTHHLSPEVMGILRGIFNLEKQLMATAQDLQQQMDSLKSEVGRNTDIDTSIKTALDGQTTLIGQLQQQIADLQAAGAGAVTQAQLDALNQQATDTLNVLKTNNDDLASKVTQGTTPPAA